MMNKTHDGTTSTTSTGSSCQQQQRARNSLHKLGNIFEKEEEQRKIGRQHPIPFPESPALDGSTPFNAYISGIESIPTSTPPDLRQAQRVRENRPGAYPVAGIGHSPGLPPDMEELGLELVPQGDRDHNCRLSFADISNFFAFTSSTSNDDDDGLIHADRVNDLVIADISNLLAFNFTRHNMEESTRNEGGLIHAEPVDDSENGEIPTAEPMATRAKKLWKKKLCLDLSLEAILAIAIVSIILVAFLLAPKSRNQTQSAKQQNGVIPIQEHPGTMASITQAPISLWERLNLPEYTLRAMENPRSPQTKAYQWLSNNLNNSNNTIHLPAWRLKQRFALSTFYYATRGDYWVKNQGWLNWDSNECTWAQFHDELYPNEAANCDDNGQLLSLQFGEANNLDGTIPPEISLLAESLETLVFTGNFQLKGNIPTEVGLMTRLTGLWMSTTHLSGTLPTELGQLQSLENLLISGSELVGTLATELGNLSNLTTLGFARVNFSGSIPTEILGLSNLKVLGFGECPLLDLTSLLTGVVGNLHNLEMLSLGKGKAGRCTSIPSEIGKLTNLATLILNDFQLNGTIPSEMGLLTKLKDLYLESNSITGTLPEGLSKMSQLKALFISANQLEGRPLEQDVLPQLTQLQWLHINDNLFSGSIATEIGLMSLEVLELQNTNLSGTFPTEILLLDNLTRLVLMNTSLTGSIPDELCGILLAPHEMKHFGGNAYTVPTTNLSVCYGTSLCGCTCEACPKA
ncbi:LRR receptor-like serine threonine-protein kinase [Seminavis robusta]|uniref:LRR receptor-like serine threonine-protein kinase n=1 Tax=Seminavis robusta TaxID=568900 RepID=A0A9N8HUG9_9STRA|nr:LRR receptor-like serine threonine-protein kinase [Seminavis robusta]|eukprot:Sro1654_g288910.1 LRR receptor-like serine threonine-protein kinase (745) ;mRNA; f:15298-17841